MAVFNALLVVGKDNIKDAREALEAHGYYDKSRRISQTARASFALPITPSAVEELIALQSRHIDDNTTLHPPLPASFSNGGCRLVHADLPASKRELASAKNGHSMLQRALTQLLDRLDPALSDRERAKLLSEVPQTWERHTDMAVLPPNSFQGPAWQGIGEELWTAVARALDCKRLARDSRILPDGYRSSGAEVLLGTDPWATHVDNGVTYVFDITKIMFSSGNISEKLRISKFDCRSETVVDLFAGIGYFTLPYLVHTCARVVHACEWNPAAVEGLRRGLAANRVEESCVVHVGDCREVCPRQVADRVNLGLLPSSECGWAAACTALRPDRGGWLHIHGNVCYKPGSDFIVKCNPWEEMKKEEEEEEEEKKKEKEEEEKEEVEEGRGGVEKAVSGVEYLSRSQLREQVQRRWEEYIVERIGERLEEGNPLGGGWGWRVWVRGVVRVKSYAPFVDHLVADVECRPVMD